MTLVVLKPARVTRWLAGVAMALVLASITG